MSTLRTCLHLSGRTLDKIDVNSFEELNEIGIGTNNSQLLYINFVNQLCMHFWFRNFVSVAELYERHPSSEHKRILEVVRVFYEGIAFLNLARDTGQAKWRRLGEKASARMTALAAINKWSFQHKSLLLNAELHYLDGDLESAEVAYKASIESARQHRFRHEEALSFELWGIFCIENHMADKGLKQLLIALDMYKQWGAMKKAKDVQLFIGLIDSRYRKGHD